jgi:hypothetical protein
MVGMQKLRRVSQVEFLKIGRHWRIKLTFEEGDTTYITDTYASQEEAEQAFQNEVERVEARRGLETLGYTI